jgi:hypothetical protein
MYPEKGTTKKQMTTETLAAISNLLNVEPHAVIVAHQRELVDAVYIEYMGEVTKMGVFLIPSHAVIFGEQLKKDNPMWNVCIVRSLLNRDFITEVTA